MAKRFKLKFSLTSFQLCRTNNETCKPTSPLPSILFSPINPKSLEISFPCNHSLLPDNPPPTPDASSKITPLSSFNSTHQKMCNSPVSVTHDDDSENRSTEWPTTPPKGRKKKYKSKDFSKRKCSVSSADSSWFSSGEEERESQMSSSENFDSSCDFGVGNDLVDSNNNNTSLTGRRRKKKKKKKSSSASVKVRRLRRYVSNSWKNGLTMMMKMPCAEEGRVNESMAVVKNSENPYEDFRGSMMEMILEKQIFEAKDLEQLLHCFLSLNSRHHHAAIVRAFSEIWELLFP